MAHKKAKRTHPLIVALNRWAKEHRLTNGEIANAVGCERSTVSRWRSDGRPPKNQRIRRELERFVSGGAK